MQDSFKPKVLQGKFEGTCPFSINKFVWTAKRYGEKRGRNSDLVV